MTTRLERDSLGEVAVPADRLWGAQTERARANFAIGTERMPPAVIHALGQVKRAAAEINTALGLLPDDAGAAIAAAATEVAAGALDDHFPLPVWQTGSGTQSNMNANEVIARRASMALGRPVHPNDDVNRGQSSNDVFPTAVALAAGAALSRDVVPAARALAAALRDKASAWREVIVIGRTHLMDATPLSLGDQATAWSQQVDLAADGVAAALPRLLALPIGGTAVGTGIGAAPGYAARMVVRLAELTGLPVTAAPSRLEATSAHDAIVAASGALRTLAIALAKVSGDVRLYGSGPRAGLAELVLPANEPGSSIMPGKVNPTQVEAVQQVVARVVGNDATIAFAGAGGQLQLHAAKPVLADAILQSARLLADVMTSFRVRCVEGLEVDRARVALGVERSLMRVTALVPVIGYDAAARAAHHAHAHGLTLREAVVALGLLDGAAFDARVAPEAMLGPP